MKDWLATVYQWLPLIIKQHCKHEQNYYLKRRHQIGYTLKAIICLLLNRDEYRGKGHLDLANTPVEVAMSNFHRWQHWEYGDAADWDYFGVGPYWRSNWFFYIGSAGYP